MDEAGQTSLFRADRIAASYPRGSGADRIFEDVSFSLEAGSIYDLTGPSGSGKSTLLRACALMLARQGGELYLAGEPSSGFHPTVWRRRVCLVPQRPSLVAGTVRDNLLLPWTLKVNAAEKPPDDDELAGLLEEARLGDVGVARDVSQLSGGQLARVALLRAFATRPDVLLLDEVDAALDAETAAAVGRLTRRLVGKRRACLRVRHGGFDGIADGVFSLREGRIACAPAEGGEARP